MKVILHNALRQPQRLDATSVVVEDDFGNPIAVAIEHSRNAIVFSGVGQADFAALLKYLGIDKTVVLNDISDRPLSDILWKP